MTSFQDISGISKVGLFLKRNKGVILTLCLMFSVVILMIVAIYAVGYHVPRTSAPTAVSGTEHDDDRHAKVFKTAAVAADATLCSKIGRSMLDKGGNAVDASIAGLLCTGMTTAQSMGIGGGFFMTIYNRTTREATTINARETAPGLGTKDMFINTDSGNSYMGGLSIAVPGEIAGYWHAHARYGSLPWKELFLPAIKMATDGFPVPESFADALQDSKKFLLADEVLSELYVNPETEELYKTGEILKYSKLAQTFRVIADEGADAFYNGTLTADILADLKEIDSIITAEDLASYRVIEEPPINMTLGNGTQLLSLSIPSSGPLVAFILNILDGYNFTPDSISSTEGMVLTYHRIVEAFKFAFAYRTELGDTDDPEVLELVRNLTSKSFADKIRTHYITDDRTHDYLYYGGTFLDHYTTGTSHLSVIDQFGNAVSTTSTINLRFGSIKMGRRTGIIFNDEMNDFSTPGVTNQWGIYPSPANFVAPGRRPFSSMCPTILVGPSGDVTGIYGAAGGSRISTATVWVMAHYLWLGDSLQQAMDRPRLHHQLLPPTLAYENILTDQALLDGLEAKGHDLHRTGSAYSAAQSVAILENGVSIGQDGHQIFAVSDMRKGGTPDGF